MTRYEILLVVAAAFNMVSAGYLLIYAQRVRILAYTFFDLCMSAYMQRHWPQAAVFLDILTDHKAALLSAEVIAELAKQHPEVLDWVEIRR